MVFANWNKKHIRKYYSWCIILDEFSIRSGRLWGVFHQLEKLWLAGYGFIFKSQINYFYDSLKEYY